MGENKDIFLDANIVFKYVEARFFGEHVKSRRYIGVMFELIREKNFTGVVSAPTFEKAKVHLVSKIFQTINCEPLPKIMTLAYGVASKIMEEACYPNSWKVVELTPADLRLLPKHPMPHTADARELLLAKKLELPFITMDSGILWPPAPLPPELTILSPDRFFKREEYRLPHPAFQEYKKNFFKACRESSLMSDGFKSLKIDEDTHSALQMFENIQRVNSIIASRPTFQPKKILLQQAR